MAFGSTSTDYSPVLKLGPSHNAFELNDLTQLQTGHEARDGSDDQGSEGKQSLGVPAGKPMVQGGDLATLVISMVAGAFAVASIQNDYLAWHLATKNYQLVIVGFLLSVENLCLNFVAPTVFLQWEARFGSSTLQNYDGLLRKSIFASRMDIWWRLVLLLTTALPLGLSAAYKQYNRGHSTIGIHNGTQQFGMYVPYGLKMPSASGGSLMYNASVAFLQDTWDVPPLPQWPQPYGYNTLLLNESSTAMLDLPNSSFVSAVQSQLELGESWNVTAQVYATISTTNSTIEQHRNEDRDSDFWYNFTMQDGVQYTDLGYNMSVGMLGNFDVLYSRDQSWLFMAIFDDPPDHNFTNLTTFIQSAQYYNTVRAPCIGTWQIASSAVQLVQGRCLTDVNYTSIDSNYTDAYQLPINNNQLNLQFRYKDILTEVLERFTDPGYSTWLKPTMTQWWPA